MIFRNLFFFGMVLIISSDFVATCFSYWTWTACEMSLGFYTKSHANDAILLAQNIKSRAQNFKNIIYQYIIIYTETILLFNKKYIL